ncbi:MAG: ThiF family adenylyltransferase [Phycisphaeraceae bacterium JB051]
MTQTPEKLDLSDELNKTGDRFDRFRLISWWDQNRLAAAKVLVVGAGALGNELVKNLALLGVGHVLIADMDAIENSNLSRSVLYREKDNGTQKSIAAAKAAKDIYPDMKVHHFDGNIVHDLGLGAYRWADVILGGLDNREARLSINRNSYKVNKPWIDGAIEQIQGIVRVFSPPGPCYECTMSEMDWKLLQMRRSCNLLSREQMMTGHTPTTPTISSIIAGVQAQEAVKLLHGMETISGKGWVFNGLMTEAYTIDYPRKDECYSHDTITQFISLDAGVEDITVVDLLNRAIKLLGPDVQLELPREVLSSLKCPKCGDEEELFASLGKVPTSKAACPKCGHELRDIQTFYKIKGDEPFIGRTLSQIGVPPFDIIIARAGSRAVGFELTGDASKVLGPLQQTEEAIEWS